MTNFLVKVNFCFVVLVLFHVRWGSGNEEPSREDEQSANTVTIRYNEVTETKWNKKDDGIDNTRAMKDTLADLVNEYCQDDEEACSLNSFSSFSSSDVVVSSSSPKNFNGDVKMSFYVSIEDKDVDPDTYVIPKATLSTICEEGGKNLTEATSGKWAVDFVGDKRITASPDRTMDSIMIPVSIILLVILCLVTLALKFYHDKEDKKHLPTSNQGVVLTTVKSDNGGGKSDEDPGSEPGPDQGLLKGQETAVNA